MFLNGVPKSLYYRNSTLSNCPNGKNNKSLSHKVFFGSCDPTWLVMIFFLIFPKNIHRDMYESVLSPFQNRENSPSPPFWNQKCCFPQIFPFLATNKIEVTKLSYHFNTFHNKIEDILLWNVLTFTAKM